MTAGRYAPSPSGDLHIGNLRTGVLAWLFARSTGREFLMRVEDLDRVEPGAEERQLDDLMSLGLEWDGPLVRQSDRTSRYTDALADLQARGLVYECFCSRREIREATSAPHSTSGMYPGTCRQLTSAEQDQRRQERPAALRLLAEPATVTVLDELHGQFTGPVDDVVLRRGDGIPAYNLAVVVDDAAQSIDQVVRGDDLLSSSPAQAHLATLLGLSVPTYAHVPMVLNTAGQRLAKRDGAVTYRQLSDAGVDVFAAIVSSLDMTGSTLSDLLDRFNPAALPREPWVFEPPI